MERYPLSLDTWEVLGTSLYYVKGFDGFPWEVSSSLRNGGRGDVGMVGRMGGERERELQYCV